MLSLGGNAQVPLWEWGDLHCLLHLLGHNSFLSCQSSWSGYASLEGMNVSRPMCECMNILISPPKGSFHIWAHCVRKDFGKIKSIIPTCRICFLLLLQMADCFDSLAINIPVSHSKRRTSHNKLYELQEIKKMSIWRWNFRLFLKRLLKLHTYIIILSTQNFYAAFCQVLAFP